ncbi:MAG: DUF3310 domain-containing protein [Staphylococcus equorum]|uniref:DUF3310 domain-containing protein n=1 Tax=Staphylococcus TaxID=1279 RepID=UPI0025532539|nr:DUF3310 domain-containing protein [Staphylococcus equorum]MDK9870653.1 DUF3310 domain-containing protein [Staphylococcus equorum]MDK9876051.1 DUF3310 domain-containing protein [Staphylococcus equorum]MDN6741266.1 DUF3310 domain-containing protein [Staphylococcus equorum]
MKIRDLDLEQYVIVYDIGKSENNNGMTVVGRVEEIVFNDDGENAATINSLGNLYDITDDNYFDLWTKSIEDKTESVSIQNKETEEIVSSGEVKATIDLSNSEFAHLRQSNDVQQRKRNDTVNHPSHYNYGDIEVINFIEQVTQHYNSNVAYHIGNAIKYLARSPHKNGKEDVAKAKWYIERAYDKWDVK